jgi:hypothetical protein
MALSEELAGLLVIIALAGVGILGAVVVVLQIRLSALRKAYASALDPSRREDLFQAVERQAGDLATLREDVHVVHSNTERLRDLLRGAVSRVGVVRYDAFEDMGGALSFSAALLDEHGNGMVISAINGRTETRTYAKAVVDHQSEHNLSAEEVQAIEQAQAGVTGEKPSRRRGRRAS